MALTPTLSAPASINSPQPPTVTRFAAADSLHESLRQTHWGAGFGDLIVEIDEGMVYLHGSVPSYHLKQMAQTLAARLSDGLPVINWLVVRASH